MSQHNDVLAWDGTGAMSFSNMQVGDFMLAYIGTQSLTEPTYSAGWTKVDFFSGVYLGTDNRGCLIIYKVATGASDTLNWTGVGSSAQNYGLGIVVRNVSGVGARSMNGIGGAANSDTTMDINALGPVAESSLIVAGTYSANTTSYSIFTRLSCGFGVGTGLSFVPASTLSLTAAGVTITGIVELTN
jgi:hypothetical protein